MRHRDPAASDKRLYEMHAQLCKVLASAKRLEVINLLRDGEKMAGELVEQMGIPKANVSQQLAVMRKKGVLESRRSGRRIFYRLAYPGMLKAYDLLRKTLMERLKAAGDRGVRPGKGGRTRRRGGPK